MGKDDFHQENGTGADFVCKLAKVRDDLLSVKSSILIISLKKLKTAQVIETHGLN